MIAEIVTSRGFQLFKERALREIQTKEKSLCYPSTTTLSSQNLADMTAIQGELKGMRWWLDKADSYQKKLEKEIETK